MPNYLGYIARGTSESGKTLLWEVCTADHFIIGHIQWYAPWRKYAFFPTSCVLDAACMRELADFCSDATRDHRAK